MRPALHILCAKLGLMAYNKAFYLGNFPPPLASIGRTLSGVVYGEDAEIGRVNFGFFSMGQDQTILALRGTEMPNGKLTEWLDDLDAFLEACTVAPGLWHRGMGRVFNGLMVTGWGGKDTPLATYVKDFSGLLCTGHSLGAPLATYAALAAKSTIPPVLFASPKAGDAQLRETCGTLWKGIPSYANRDDAVPRLPITVNKPWKIEDFQQMGDLIELEPDSVAPPVPGDWFSAHALTNYARLLEAA